MIDLYEIVTASEKIIKSSELAALATIVRVDGSHYREIGSRILISSKGKLYGRSGGGCFESDLIKHSAKVINSNKPILIKYSTSGADDPLFGSGTGCGGEVYYLLERYTGRQKHDPIKTIKRCLTKREKIIMATIINIESETVVTQSYTCFADGSVSTDVTDPSLLKILTTESSLIKSNESYHTIKYDKENNNVEILWEILMPPLSLVIFGGGDDALPLVNFAKQLGWTTTVVDYRAGFASRDRFINADRTLTIGNDQILKQIAIDERTAVVIITHNFLHDQELLKLLLPANLFYVGLLGSKKRVAGILEGIKGTAKSLTENNLKKLFAPVGCDIGATGSVEIALAIISEIQAVYKKKPAGFLRDKQL